MAGFRHILATTDFSEQAKAGVSAAVELAQSLGSRVTLLYVAEDRMPPVVVPMSDEEVRELRDSHQRHAQEELERYAGEHLGGVEVDPLVVVGRPYEQIVETARELGVDLIVMATHGYGFVGSVVFGSTAERVVRHADCPVMVVRSERPD